MPGGPFEEMFLHHNVERAVDIGADNVSDGTDVSGLPFYLRSNHVFASTWLTVGLEPGVRALRVV